MEESGQQHQEAFKELRTARNLALHVMKATVHAIGKTMASLVVLERHLWLNITEIKDAEKMAFLDSLVSSNGLSTLLWVGLRNDFQRLKRCRRCYVTSSPSALDLWLRTTRRPPPLSLKKAGAASVEIQAWAAAAPLDIETLPLPKASLE